ncbi:MAG TPA: hypothetical protein VIL66_06930 [Bacillota bacterium]
MKEFQRFSGTQEGVDWWRAAGFWRGILNYILRYADAKGHTQDWGNPGYLDMPGRHPKVA